MTAGAPAPVPEIGLQTALDVELYVISETLRLGALSPEVVEVLRLLATLAPDGAGRVVAYLAGRLNLLATTGGADGSRLTEAGVAYWKRRLGFAPPPSSTEGAASLAEAAKAASESLRQAEAAMERLRREGGTSR